MSGGLKKVALIIGGKSTEREVSLASGQSILEHIDRKRFEVSVYDPAEDLPRLAAEASALDVAFLALHGKWGEDGTMQGFCEMLGLPYTGSGVMASAMAMDKEVSKKIYRDVGLPVAPDMVVGRMNSGLLAETVRAALHILGSPLVVKPLRQGSSVGLSIVENEKDLLTALTQVFDLEGSALLEKYLPGRELTCGVVGNNTLTALPPIEIIPAEGHLFFDYSAKYEPGEAREICPAEIPADLTEEVGNIAVTAHRSLCCRGMSRSDFMYSGGRLYLLETNTLPGLTSGSLLPKMVRAYGMTFTGFISYIIDLALAPGDVDIESYRS